MSKMLEQSGIALPALDASSLMLTGAAGGALGLAGAIGAILSKSPGGAPYEASATALFGYDPVAAEAFYAARPLLVIGRILRISRLTAAFNVKLLLDLAAYKLAGSPEDTPWPNEKERAKECLALATQLGPTFIKLAQALSIRTDLIPEPYALELRQLQDAVPPFDSAVAKTNLAGALGVSDGAAGLRTVFRTLSEQPLASASIGQVYKGELLDGRAVAVKVQRPGILGEIALDLHVLRLLAPIQTRLSNAINGLQTYPDDIRLARDLVDEWGRGFVAETDCTSAGALSCPGMPSASWTHGSARFSEVCGQPFSAGTFSADLFEARATVSFREAMVSRGLAAVTAPAVLPELSTGTILTTAWVEGTRLDLDASPDVPRLCAVAINAYELSLAFPEPSLNLP